MVEVRSRRNRAVKSRGRGKERHCEGERQLMTLMFSIFRRIVSCGLLNDRADATLSVIRTCIFKEFMSAATKSENKTASNDTWLRQEMYFSSTSGSLLSILLSLSADQKGTHILHKSLGALHSACLLHLINWYWKITESMPTHTRFKVLILFLQRSLS